ncbi:hypothetical protein AB1Y20_014123 [Prymnesium parvum]|uniref:DNA repair and recombination protein RAD54-like n=1 Tax=Prymnesium parvum TaxID=97485 RepID=A0AB34IG51_PRYPA
MDAPILPSDLPPPLRLPSLKKPRLVAPLKSISSPPADENAPPSPRAPPRCRLVAPLLGEAYERRAAPRPPPPAVLLGLPRLKRKFDISRAGGSEELASMYRPPPRPECEPNALVLHLPADKTDGTSAVVVDDWLSDKLRLHQREGVKFIWEACMGKSGPLGCGCILADDMGLGKTLQTIAVIWTFLKQSIEKGRKEGEYKSAMVVCPTSLVWNWAKEVKLWLGTRLSPIVVTSGALHGPTPLLCASYHALMPLPLADMKKEDQASRLRMFLAAPKAALLISSYETITGNIEMVQSASVFSQAIDFIICDEAHRLKNPETKVFKQLYCLRSRARVLVSGTPVQNDLSEFFALVDFCIPGCLGTRKEWTRTCGSKIKKMRELDATEKEVEAGKQASDHFTEQTKTILLRRTNEIISKYLPPKYDFLVFCALTDEQVAMYDKTVRQGQKTLDGPEPSSALITVNKLRKICCTPQLLLPAGAPAVCAGKLQVLTDLLCRTRAACSDRFVLISNFTSVLDLFEDALKRIKQQYLRLDGSQAANRRQAIVDKFNDPQSPYFCFLLSSRAGGCGINLIGANRLVLFDPDWNPATDAQALARVWRSGQQKQCFIYRFISAGTLEERVLQRQQAKEGLRDQIIDDNMDSRKFSSDELRELFKPAQKTLSNVHDSLGCRCLSCPHGAETSDAEGYSHLLPRSEALEACDAMLGASEAPCLNLVFARKTDNSTVKEEEEKEEEEEEEEEEEKEEEEKEEEEKGEEEEEEDDDDDE